MAHHYRLLVFTCEAHSANLVVRTAICDVERKADDHPLAATSVRFFKYLMPEYAPEFVARLGAFVNARLQLRPSAPPQAVVAQWVGLHKLYGKQVIHTAYDRSSMDHQAHGSIGPAMPAVPAAPPTPDAARQP